MIERLYPKQIANDAARWQALLAEQGLRPEESIDAVYGLYEDGELIGTGSRFQNILKCIAIRPDYQGGAAFNALLSHLMNEVYAIGFRDIYVYTKPNRAQAFQYLGFTKVEEVPSSLIFLEKSSHPITQFMVQLQEETARAMCEKERTAIANANKIGAIVLNANPFTKGHLSLIERAYAQVDRLHLFVVREDRSVFPYAVRRSLVEAGIQHLPQCFVHETRSYLVSSATFPGYFLPEDADLTRIQATLDARIFRTHFAPALQLTDRFVAEEPLSVPTQIYNEAMHDVISAPPEEGQLHLHILPRLSQADAPISASTVRRLLSEEKNQDAYALLPPATIAFLESEAAKPILEALHADPLHGEKEADQRAQ